MKNLLRPVADLVDDYAEEFPIVKSNFGRVKKTLRTFAISEGKTLPSLLLLDVCNKQNHQLPEELLLSHIAKSLKKGHGGQTITRITRMLEVFSPVQNKADDGSLLDVCDIPPLLREKLAFLPRIYPESRKNIPTSMLSDPEYLKNLPLTKNSRILLQAILSFYNENEISEETIDLDLNSDKLKKEIRNLCSRYQYDRVCATLSKFLKKLGVQNNKKKSFIESAYERLPPKIKRQCEIFLEKASSGISDPKLQKIAAMKGVRIERIEEITIRSYIKSFKLMISQIEIPYDEDMDITSFLKIDIKTITDETGKDINYQYNSFVEKIRDIERNKETPSKRAGYDSSQFSVFLCAIKSIAAFNGIFSYHESFNLVYRARMDKKLKEKRKNKKRRVYNLIFIDREIERLLEEVKQIVHEESFIDDRSKRPPKTARRNLRKCLFLVMLTMLRYLGVRQQLLRDCEVDKNIIFVNNQRIDFYWCEESNKNKVEIYGYFDKDAHKTHEIMIEVLNLYYENIFPYVNKISIEKSNQFLYFPNRSGQIEPFNKLTSSQFSRKFKLWAYTFLNTEEIEKDCEDSIHAHLLRSHCVNWLLNEYDVSSSKAASFIGDTETTMNENYRNKSKSYNLNDAVNEANRNRKIKEEQSGTAYEPLLNLLEQSLKKQASLEAEIKRLKKQVSKKPKKGRLNM